MLVICSNYLYYSVDYNLLALTVCTADDVLPFELMLDLF